MGTHDLRPIIEGWPYEPGQINVRKIRGDDHKVRIQMRVDLGVLQMEVANRPDGQRPHDQDSLLAYHLEQLEAHKLRNGTELGFALTPEECRLIREESLQYYQRYLAFFALEDYKGVIEDTQHNLDILDLCVRYADEESDRYALEAYRPYIIMMNVRGKAMDAIKRGSHLTALAHVERGLDSVKAFFKEYGDRDAYRQSSEVGVLKALRREIRSQLPDDPIRRLKRQLARAIREERYEEAARLRDELDLILGETDPPEIE